MSAKKDENVIYNFVYDTSENVDKYFNTLKFEFYEKGKIHKILFFIAYFVYVYI